MLIAFAVIFALIILGQVFFFKDKGKQPANPAPNQAAESSKPAAETPAAPAKAAVSTPAPSQTEGR